jgi:CRISPR type II-A-associated protein Csn2
MAGDFMKLNNADYNLLFDMKENQINVLVVENQHAFSDIVSSLYFQCQGGEGHFILSDANKALKIANEAEILLDLFSLDFNNRKILGKLYAELDDIGKDYIQEKENINASIVQNLDEIILKSRYDHLDFQIDLQWTELFKLYKVKIEQDFENLLEKLIEYMKVLVYVCNISVLILVNTKAYFDSEEQKQIYEMANLLKLQLVLIESRESMSISEEKVYIIDKDLCLIEK